MFWTTLFFASMLLLFLLPLAPALVEWRLKKDATPLKIVQEYDGNITHFATSFRHFVDERFKTQLAENAVPTQSGDGILESGIRYHTVALSGEPVFTPEENRSHTTHKLILSNPPLKLPGGMFFEAEVYGAQDIESGNLNTFRAILANRKIRLDDGCAVIRWAHAEDRIIIGKHAKLYGRISAGKEITLGAHSHFARMHAPVIRFGAPLTPVPQSGIATKLQAIGMPSQILDKSAQRWLLKGSLTLPPGSFHHGHLVARKDITVGCGSFIMGSIKSAGDLFLEGNLRIDGAVISACKLHIGSDCIIKGPVVSETMVVIERGAIIGTTACPTTITAPEIRIAEDSVVHGTVWARKIGVVTSRG